MKKILSVLLVVLLSVGALAACAQVSESGSAGEPYVPAEVVEPDEASQPEQETPKSEETTEPEPDYSPDFIPIIRPFKPKRGNVVMLSRSFQNTLIFTEDAIWKILDYWTFSEEHNGDVWQLTEPTRMMDSVVATDNIERVIGNTHILTTDQTLYFLDFERGETVRQVENVTSTYHFHFGTLYNPLRYVRAADGSAWRVDSAEAQRLPDDIELFDGMPREDSILDIVSADKWFDYNVRTSSGLFVVTEDNVLWEFDSWATDAVPSIIKEDVQVLHWGFIITTDNVLWQLPLWDDREAGFQKIMENVRLFDNWLIITTDNDLWGFRPWNGSGPFKIMDNVQSIQSFFGFITMDDTLWWLPGWRMFEEYQEPVRVMENALRTWWNWSESEYILTTDGSLWLFIYGDDDFDFVQIFQAAS